MHAPFGTACLSQPCATARHWRRFLLCTAFLPLMFSAPAQAQRIDSATPQTLMMQSQTPAMAPPVSTPAPAAKEAAPENEAKPAPAPAPKKDEPPHRALPEYVEAMTLFDQFDINKDGKVEDYEVSTAARALFRHKDMNKDGELLPFENTQGTLEMELRRMPAEKRKDYKMTIDDLKRYETWYAMVDTNGDKVITEYENLRFFREEFAKFDAERKGFATRAEYMHFLDQRFLRGAKPKPKQ